MHQRVPILVEQNNVITTGSVADVTVDDALLSPLCVLKLSMVADTLCSIPGTMRRRVKRALNKAFLAGHAQHAEHAAR